MDQKKLARPWARRATAQATPPGYEQHDAQTRQQGYSSPRTLAQPGTPESLAVGRAGGRPTGSPSAGFTKRITLIGFRNAPADIAGRVKLSGIQKPSAETTEEPRPLGFRRPPAATAGQLGPGGLGRSAPWAVQYPAFPQVRPDQIMRTANRRSVR